MGRNKVYATHEEKKMAHAAAMRKRRSEETPEIRQQRLEQSRERKRFEREQRRLIGISFIEKERTRIRMKRLREQRKLQQQMASTNEEAEVQQDVEMADVSEENKTKEKDSISAMKAKLNDNDNCSSTNGDDKKTNGDHDDESDNESNDGEDEIEEVDRVNGARDNDNDDDELSIDDEEMDEEEEEEIEEVDSDFGEVQSDSRDGMTPSTNGDAGKSNNRRKSPMKVREIEEIIDSDEDDENDVEEVKEDESGDDDDNGSSDSDIMEVEAEDPLAAPSSSSSSKAGNSNSAAHSESSMSVKPKSSSTPNVVTIDDVRTLHKIANANRGAAEPDKPVVIDTSTILAGKATSGVTITPARPKTNSNSPSMLNVPSGVTISSSSKGPGVPLRAGVGALGANTAFGYDTKGQLNDPNLTDDTFVVEAPSFIVPYVYEKPPKESFEEFRDSIKKAIIVEAQKKETEEKEKQKDESGDKKDDDDDEEKSKDKKEEDVEKVKDDDEIVELNNESNEPKKKSPNANYFESSLGEFLIDLGMNLVQENVQADLLKQQIRRSQKDKSAAVMHAIMSLKKNLESSKDHNEPFHMKEIKCRYCSFRTESELAMQHHLETPHMKHMMYRCNFCRYETKLPTEVLEHMLASHGIRGRLERAPAQHQCPQCPFEDNMKGKLTRHKNSCDKRFRPERNQESPLDWEPPAKIPKPAMMNKRPVGGMGYPMGAAQQLSQLANMRSGQNKNIYSGMPPLQMGGGMRGRGRPVFGSKAEKIPSHLSMNRQGMNNFAAFTKASNQMLSKNFLSNQSVVQAMNQSRFTSGNKILSNLGSNSSVTIQSVSQRNANNRSGNTPSISITPLPGRQGGGAGTSNMMRSKSQAGATNSLKPGQPSAGGAAGSQAAGGKGSFVICEICDGYIKDLEQLRNHMLWIHKVKIHPKMIYNRPPLNCQKCQFRFFTDQGLERHLLGSHGLVTASMQELANKGQDSGRCPVCGKVYQWKLLNHVAKDHQKTLKPAHLSYKCTVCTATFGQYKLFETHVYQAHSGAAKKGGNNSKQQSLMKSSANSTSKPPIKLPGDITITSKKAASAAPAASAEKKPSSSDTTSKTAATSSSSSNVSKKESEEVIGLDDEEEIDDVEEEKQKLNKKSNSDNAGEKMEGVEEIEEVKGGEND